MPLVQSSDYFNNSEILNRSIAVIQVSGEWSPANRVLADVYVVGGGGGGGGAVETSGTYKKAAASGGAAGSVGASRLILEPGTVYTITIGAGGSGSATTAGAAGSATEFSGSGITTINAPGGNGGLIATSNTTAAAIAAGVTGGGVATGGNLFNVNGSTSGTAECSAGAVDNLLAATGGTVPGLFTRDESLTSGACTASTNSGAGAVGAAPSLLLPSDGVTETFSQITYEVVKPTVGGTRGYLGVESFTILGPYTLYSGDATAGFSNTTSAGLQSDPYIRASGGAAQTSPPGVRWARRGAMGCGGGGSARNGVNGLNSGIGGDGFVAIIPIKLLEGV